MMIKFTKFLQAITFIIYLFIASSVNAQMWPPIGMNGNGTSGNPWQITTITHLMQLSTYVNIGNGSETAGEYYKLMNDIDFANSPVPSFLGFDPIGNTAIDAVVFQGNFDGNGKVILNLKINRISTWYIGLFGYVYNATIHNLGIEACNIIGDRFVGGLVGQADNSTIENCYVSGSVSGTRLVGGLVGNNNSFSVISHCYATCDMSAYRYIGGLTGVNYGTIETSYSGGIIINSDEQIGGFVGCNYNSIRNCYATGNVFGQGMHIGGFAGANKEGNITYCYASGEVSGTRITDYVGGFTGINTAVLRNCVAANNIVTGGTSNVNRITGENAGIFSHNYAFDGMVITPIGGESGINANWNTLMSFNFYKSRRNWYNNIPWKIDTDDNLRSSWKICDDETLPFLQWEGIACDTLNPYTCDFTAYGIGVQGDPYRIYYPCQLATLATFVNSGNGAQTLNKYFKLMNDIDLIDYSYGAGWNPIGNDVNIINQMFQGNLDGNSKIIYNLKINRGTTGGIGLFGSIYNATIHHLGIEDCNIYGSDIGALAGCAKYSPINNCYATGYVTGSGLAVGDCVGGLVGNYRYSTIDSCFALCHVTGPRNRIGGLIGEAAFSNYVRNCYATGNVTGTGLASIIGGLVGFSATCNITNCYATGNITGSCNFIGGLTGDGTGGVFSYCYARGTVKGTVGTYYVGGLNGFMSGGSIINCVAANDSVFVQGENPYCVNRITGIAMYNPVLSNNYAYDNMVITPNGGVAGISTPMATLKSFNFYNTSSNWYNNIPWSIANVANLSVIWRIFDGVTLPFFQWQ